ncbi:MAG TPA: hypothetical protein O0X38_07110 [Methanocorpusculum sp.]|nr:hypothetical protein [Methanocorpusculum sp.]
MKKQLLFALTLAVSAVLGAAELSDAASAALQKVVPGTITMKDANTWLYSRNELEHLSRGPLANGNVINVSVAKRNQDPITALAEFHDSLKKLGIRLILVPVPPKAAVKPFTGLQKGDAMQYLKPFYSELRARGIEVLDLSDAFQNADAEKCYCRTDAHWSPFGIAIAADELAKLIPLKDSEKYVVTARIEKISGDLAKSLNASSPETEELPMQTVVGKTIAENAPVLLMGDSHTLVFSTGGDMLASDAGLAELLALRLGMPIDRIGVKGSAATAVRINLFRKAKKDPAWLKNKKVVIYCFTCREFTESAGGWTVVPVLK